MADAYWIGKDGNIWLKGADGVQNLGAADGSNGGQYVASGNTLTDRFADYPGQPGSIRNATLIADPVATAPAPDATTSGVAPKVFNAAGASNTQRTIDQLPGLLRDALASEATTYGNTVGGYDATEKQQRQQYDTGTVTNQQNYDQNYMDSIRAGIHGLGGVMSLLRGTGAAGGSAEDVARDTVGGVTANDIRTGHDTQQQNQGALDNSLGSFLTDLQIKRKQAEDTRVNNERALRRDSNTQLQDLFGKMAGFYGDVGNTTASNSWMNRAGDLTPDIAANSRTQVSPYDTTPVAVKAPEVTAFAAPTNPSIVAPPSDGQIGSGIFTMSGRRKEKAPTAPVGV